MTTQTGRQTQGVGSPISNEAYNVLTALQSKLEGLEAYRKYAASGGETSCGSSSLSRIHRRSSAS